MSLTAGIIGLPNVGKSTLFNAITESKAEIANYPFATIKPNVGIVDIEDERLNFLVKYWKSKKKVNNSFTFTDIAGLVKGASKGEGLGNQFLSNIREVDILVHVVRVFENSDIIHVENNVDPIRDMETINLELIISDLEIVEKRLAKIEKKSQITNDKDLIQEVKFLKKILEILNSDTLISSSGVDKECLNYANRLGLITSKETIYVANVDEKEISNLEGNDSFTNLSKEVKKLNSKLIPISAKIEYEISQIEDKEERSLFLNELGLNQTGLNFLTREVMESLNLGTFFTAGPEESRSWTFKKTETVKESSGIIHTDISKGFIAAEIYQIEDLKELGSFNSLKLSGKLRMEGKNYFLKEGDVCFFKFNV